MYQPPVPLPQVRQPSRAEGIDITAFVLSFFLPLIGFILGWVGLAQAHKQNRNAHGLTIAAMIIGGLGTVLITIWIIIAIAASASAAGG